MRFGTPLAGRCTASTYTSTMVDVYWKRATGVQVSIHAWCRRLTWTVTADAGLLIMRAVVDQIRVDALRPPGTRVAMVKRWQRVLAADVPAVTTTEDRWPG